MKLANALLFRFQTNLFFAHFVFSCIVGYFCTLFYESPFMNLQKLIFEGKISAH